VETEKDVVEVADAWPQRKESQQTDAKDAESQVQCESGWFPSGVCVGLNPPIPSTFIRSIALDTGSCPKSICSILPEENKEDLI
jgi:hypothetical protein